MKAILIDVIKRTVSLIEIEKGIDGIYKAMGCELFTCPFILPNEDTLYVDDEGLLNGNMENGFFKIEGYSEFLAGNSLLLGSNEEGGSEDVKSNVDDIRKKIKFYSLFEVSLMVKGRGN